MSWPPPRPESEEAEMYYEIRRERAKPGRGPDLVRWMDEVVIPIHIEAGMDVVGSFVDRDDEDGFVWIRRFASDEERERVVEAAHNHPRFATDIAPAASELFDGEAETMRLIPTRIDPVPRA
jgi:hypothetical protein